MSSFRSAAVAGTALLLCAGLLGGCAGTGTGTGTGGSSGPTTRSAAVTVSDAWAKTAAKDMTAVYGVIQNAGTKAVTITDVAITRGGSPVADLVQMHEVVTVNGVAKMQPKPGGFTVAPNASLTLAPGGFHIMLLGLKSAINAGDTLDVTLSTSAGDKITFAALAKDFAGGNEKYQATPTASAGMG